MKFSTRTTYGLRAMAYLAKRHRQGRSIALSRIAEDEQISLPYLERLFARLKRAGLVKAEIGPGGGYALARPPDKLDLFCIVKTLEGNVVPFHCIDSEGQVRCAARSACGTSAVLAKVYAAISQTLKGIKLNELS